MVIVVMGASGAGKTTVGTAVAEALGWPFLDADDFHPAANIQKMSRGEALTDADRWPWLDALRAAIATGVAEGRSVVVACSALKRQYRTALTKGLPDVRFVHLHAGADLLTARLRERRAHFAGPVLVPTQLSTLEAPDEALTIDAAAPVDDIVQTIVRAVTPAT